MQESDEQKINDAKDAQSLSSTKTKPVDEDGAQATHQGVQKQMLDDENINKKLDKQQETLNKISDTLKDMNSFEPPKEKKEEKKDKKFKFWDDFFKDIVKTSLKVGGALLMFCVLMGAFTALAGILFIIGFVCLLCTDPAFEIYEEKIKPSLQKGIKVVKDFISNTREYHKQKKEFKRIKKQQAIEETKTETQQESPKEEKTQITDKTTVEKTTAQPQKVEVIQEDIKQQSKPNVNQTKDQLLTNKTPLNVAPKQDVQTKLFEKTKLNPLFVKSTERKDNAQAL